MKYAQEIERERAKSKKRMFEFFPVVVVSLHWAQWYRYPNGVRQQYKAFSTFFALQWQNHPTLLLVYRRI